MTQVFDANNRAVPVTVVEAGPCPVTQVKTQETDGYNAVQFGFGTQKAHRVRKPQQGHFKKAKVDAVREMREFRTEDAPEAQLGEVLTVERFEEGQMVDVIGTTKGKGFQGVVRRFGYGGGPASHGSMFHRRGGSFGQCQWPGEIAKGKNMPGHMGDVQRTAQNLEIVKIDSERNLLLIKGSFPGAKGATVYIRAAKKTKKANAA